MANGHIEIHDPISNHNGLSGRKDGDSKPSSDTDSMEDTDEFRLIMAYATRRRTKEGSPTQDKPNPVKGDTDANGLSSPETPAKTETEMKKKKKKKGLKLPNIFRCIKPQTKEDELCQTHLRQPDVDDRCGDFKESPLKKEDEFEEAASKLTEIADEIPFIRPEIEADSPEDMNVEKVIGLLLREAGDRLNEEHLKDAAISAELFWNYGFFEKLMQTFLRMMGLWTDPERPGPKASTKSQIAVACEVTSRLSAVNTLPSSRLLDHGARYLRSYFSSWAQQQGGYEEAFYSDDEDDIQ